MRLVIAGYYGFGNYGDELLLAALLGSSLKSSHDCSVLSHDTLATSKQHQVRAVLRWNPVRIFNELLHCQGLVFGGGGLVQDLSGVFTPAYYLGILVMAQKLRRKTLLLGQGFGPLQRPLNRFLARTFLPRCDLIVPRDYEGFNWCLEMGVPETRLCLGADLAWLLPEQKKSSGTDWAVCLRADWLGGKSPAWLKPLLTLAQQQGRRLRFVALGNRGDQELIRRLQSQPEFAGCAVENATWGQKPVDSLFTGTELVISMRYHGLILGARAGAAVTGLGQDFKLRYLLRELNQPHLLETTLIPQMEEILKSLPQWQQRLAVSVPLLRQRAWQGMEAAKAILFRGLA